jgi:hypothetical protein
MYRRLPLLLLLAAPLWGQVSEDVRPDGEDDPSTWRLDDGGTGCDAADCFAEVDEDPDGVLDDLEVNTGTNNDAITFTFETPTTCTAPSGDQVFNVRSSRCTEAGVETANGTTPNYGIELWCGGVLQLELAATHAVATLDQDDRHTWAWDADCASDGSDVEVYFEAHRAGGGGNRRYPCIEAVEWECEMPAASTRSRAHVIGR